MIPTSNLLPANSAQLTIDGGELSISQIRSVASDRMLVGVTCEPSVREKLIRATALVDKAVAEKWQVYGVTTGFGGMADVTVPFEMSAASQVNLLAFLATGAGDEIQPSHVRGAMLLRANVLLQGCSGARVELIERLTTFLNQNATPVVKELGSIGASGDLVPLSTIARAITGHARGGEIDWSGERVSTAAALQRLGLEPIELLPKEGLALVNGTSFSAAIAADNIYQSQKLMALCLAANVMMLVALDARREPFEPFVHQKKRFPGQIWTAKIVHQLLAGTAVQPGAFSNPAGAGVVVQDRYSMRCLPQYFGSIVEGLKRIQSVVEIEANAVSDNPLISASENRFYQSGNFLGQYVGLAMDDLRKFIGLMAKHLDVQIATLCAPEFNGGLPASLRGNESIPYNMGLKGLQITGNSIMPTLAFYGNSIVDRFPTHAEQFNQNINGLSWTSAALAEKSVNLFRHYLCVALIFAVQAVDLKSLQIEGGAGNADGRLLLGPTLVALYESVCRAIDHDPSSPQPLIFNDGDQALDQYLVTLHEAIDNEGPILDAVESILKSFEGELS